MFSNQSKNTIIHLIKDVIKGEKELEAFKQTLILHLSENEVSYQTCFLHISFEKGKIYNQDLEALLHSQQIRFDQQELSMMKYQNYHDFLELLLPNNQIFLKQYQQKQMNYNNPNADTLQIIGKIFGKNIEIIRKIQAYLDTLLIRFDKNSLINFLCPKNTEKNSQIFLQLLKNIDLDISLEDVVCAIRRLDKDQDSDVGKFDWEELIQYKRQNQKQRKSISKQISNKSINKSMSKSRQTYNQENINSNRQVHFQELKSSDLQFQKSAKSFILDEHILQFQLHLVTIGKLQDEIDTIKLELSTRADYSIQEAFNFFDLDLNNEINQQDLKLSLMQLGLETSEYYIRQLLYYFSTSHTRMEWDLTDFKSIFPINREGFESVKGTFTFETKKIIKSLISKILEYISYKKKSTEEIARNDRGIEIIFNYLDQDQNGIISQDDFKVLEIKPKYGLMFFQTFQDYPYQLTINQFEQYFV